MSTDSREPIPREDIINTLGAAIYIMRSVDFDSPDIDKTQVKLSGGMVRAITSLLLLWGAENLNAEERHAAKEFCSLLELDEFGGDLSPNELQ